MSIVPLLLSVSLAGLAQTPIISTYAGGGVNPSGGPATSAYIGPVGTVVPDGAGGFYLASAIEIFHVAADGSIQLKAEANVDPIPANITDLAMDAAGNLYISTPYYVHKLSIDGAIIVVAGSGGGPIGDGGPATSADLAYVDGIALDQSGNLFIVDYGRIRKVTPDGLINTIAGNGQEGYAGDEGPATAAKIHPSSVAVDSLGNIYIAEPNRVRKVTTDGIIHTIAGNGIDLHSGDGGPATEAQIRTIGGISIDGAGNLYLAEKPGQSIRKISAAGIITTISGNGVQGFNGDNQPATLAQLNYPFDVAVEADGSYDIADLGNLRVRRVGVDGVIRTVAGRPGSPGDGSAADAVSLFVPTGVAFDGAGNLYIAEKSNRRIRKVDSTGIISTTAGGGASNREDAPAWEASFQYPFGVAVDSQGRVYIADAFYHVVRRVSLDGTIRTFAGTWVTGNSGDEGPATSAKLSLPTGLKFDAAGNLYILDSGNQNIRKVGTDGVIHTFLRPPGPGDIAFDADGNAYISDFQAHTVTKLSVGGTHTTVAGTGIAGYGGDGGPANAAQLNAPIGLAFDDTGNLYIAEGGNHVIRKVTPDGIINTVAGNGNAGYAGDGGPASAAQLNTPGSIAFDAHGNLYIADAYNDRIRKIDSLAPSPRRRRGQLISN